MTDGEGTHSGGIRHRGGGNPAPWGTGRDRTPAPARGLRRPAPLDRSSARPPRARVEETQLSLDGSPMRREPPSDPKAPAVMKHTFALLVAASALSAPSALAQAPTFFQLPTGVYPTDVSTAGGTVVVVGYSTITGQAVRWTPTGGDVQIGSDSGQTGANVRITRDGTKIVGELNGANGTVVGYYDGVVWTPIPSLPGSQSGTAAILGDVNDDGTVIVGMGYSASNQAHPFKWTLGGGTVDLQPFFSSPQSRAFGVSGDGTTVVGWEANGGPRLGTRWVGASPISYFTYTDPSMVVHNVGEAYAMNNTGTIAVGYRIHGLGTEAWRWDSGPNAVTPLPNLPGHPTSALATALNDSGSMIVGTDGANFITGATAILWQNNVPVSLTSYLTGLGMTGLSGLPDLGYPTAISPEGGAIVGRFLTLGGPDHGWVVLFPSVLPNGTPFCAGDGSGTACPCGNNSPLGDNLGCVSSLALGGKLRGGGQSSVTTDSFVLTSTQVPNGPALYFQGDAQMVGGAGVSFGDGLLCAGGNIIRLGVKFAAGGNTSSFPGVGDPLISVQGAVAPGDTRYYQAWYRDAVIGYCTTAVYNLSNGLTVSWTN